jgi:hypothetical protein
VRSHVSTYQVKPLPYHLRTPTEYEVYYRSNREEDHPDEGKPFTVLRLDGDRRNEDFCNSYIMYLNPHGTPEDEVALVTEPYAEGVMMEWERPISMSFILYMYLTPFD